MPAGPRRAGVIAALLALVGLLPVAAIAAPGDTTVASVASTGEGGQGSSYDTDVSADGRFVAFQTHARNIASDGDGIGVHDRLTGETVDVAVSSDGVPGSGSDSWPSISADGRFVAFASSSRNLVAGDTNNSYDVFVRDRDSDADGIFDEPGAATTTRVSLYGTPNKQRNGPSSDPAISASGRHVAFWSWNQVYVRDRDTDADGIFDEPGEATTIQVSTGGAWSGDASISDDGRLIAFESDASIAPDDTNGVSDVYVRDIVAGTTERVSVSSTGEQGNDGGVSPFISGNGRYVAFQTSSTNFDGARGLFVRDLVAKTTARIDSPYCELPNHGTYRPSLSRDGRFAAFFAKATNLVSGDDNEGEDVYVRDIATGRSFLASVSSAGRQGVHTEGSTIGPPPALSADGSVVAWWSRMWDLLPDARQGVQILVHEIGPPPPAPTSSDTEAPAPPEAASPADGASFSSGSVAVSGTAEPWARVRIYEGEMQIGFADAGARGRWSTDLWLLNGSHTISAVAVDPACNRSAPSPPRTISVQTPGTTALVSLAPGGELANAASHHPAPSWGARFVAFDSYASNLVAQDTNGLEDVFVRETATGGIERVSVPHDGQSGGGGGWHPQISWNGRYVAFESLASDLVPGDNNSRADIFVRDRLRGSTVRATVSSEGTETNEETHPTYGLSGDGRHVVFNSTSAKLVAGDTNGVNDVFVRDLGTSTTVRVSVSTSGDQANGPAWGSAISADGRFVGLWSAATNLTPDGADGTFVHDRDADEDGIFDEPGAIKTSKVPWGDVGGFSANGRFMLLGSSASLLGMSYDWHWSVFLYDRDTDADGVFDEDGATRLQVVSAQPEIGEPRWDSYDPSISADGRFVAVSSQEHLVPGYRSKLFSWDAPRASCFDAYVWDRITGEFRVASISSEGDPQVSGRAVPVISPDGRFVAFDSGASNLVPPAPHGVFLRDVYPRPDPPAIASPPEGALLGSQTVEVSGTAQPGSLVRLFEQSAALGSATAADDGAWAIPVSLADGEHSLAATAQDTRGEGVESLPRRFAVDTAAPPVPSISRPRDRALYNSSAVALAGAAEPMATVEILEAGAVVARAQAASDGTWSAEGSFAAGEHQVQARATDRAGNTGVASSPRRFTVDPSMSLTHPPARVVSPAPFAVLTGTSEVLIRWEEDRSGEPVLGHVLAVGPPGEDSFLQRFVAGEAGYPCDATGACETAVSFRLGSGEPPGGKYEIRIVTIFTDGHRSDGRCDDGTPAGRTVDCEADVTSVPGYASGEFLLRPRPWGERYQDPGTRDVLLLDRATEEFEYVRWNPLAHAQVLGGRANLLPVREDTILEFAGTGFSIGAALSGGRAEGALTAYGEGRTERFSGRSV